MSLILHDTRCTKYTFEKQNNLCSHYIGRSYRLFNDMQG
ncbi:hypothetical protein PT7_1790 [Pusillimonas sp. T7-7]|nr:hypothetical protein PT7_1790 [Pusillimonas sp. T7-7]